MADPTQTNISQTTIPDYAKPYVENLLGIAQGTAFQTDASGKITGMQPYKSYPGERTADFTDLQNKAFQGAQNLGPASQLTDATSLAQKAGLGALGIDYGTGKFANQFTAPGAYQAGQFTNQYGYTPDSFLGQGTAAAYMNPYMQNVVDIQQREARRQAGIGATQQQAQAVQAGAFGGSRDAIMRAERERNLATQLGDIQATGSNAAYNQAMQQFNAEQAARMQSAGMGAQYGTQAQQMGEMSRQFGYGKGLEAAGLGAQYGQAANQLGEQSRQFGAGLGLQGLQTALQGAGALGNLGATQFGQQAQTIGIQGQLGGTQQQQQQNILNQQYQDFLNQKQYPYQQIGFMSDMLRGLPLAQSSTAMYSNPNLLTQAAGAVGTAYMGNKLFGGASGGLPEDFKKKERPAGLAELAIYNMA